MNIFIIIDATSKVLCNSVSGTPTSSLYSKSEYATQHIGTSQNIRYLRLSLLPGDEQDGTYSCCLIPQFTGILFARFFLSYHQLSSAVGFPKVARLPFFSHVWRYYSLNSRSTQPEITSNMRHHRRRNLMSSNVLAVKIPRKPCC